MKLAINYLSHLTLYTVLSSPVQIQNQVIRLHSLNVTPFVEGDLFVTDVMNEYHDLVPTLLLISALST